MHWAQSVLTAGHSLEYPLQYLRKHLGKFSSRVRLQQVGGQKARTATPVSSPSSQQFHIVARAIYETVRPEQVGVSGRNTLYLGVEDSVRMEERQASCLPFCSEAKYMTPIAGTVVHITTVEHHCVGLHTLGVWQ